MKRILLITVIVVLAIFIITNPSSKNFKEFTEDYTVTGTSQIALYYYHNPIRKRLFNGFVFSTYQIQIIGYDDEKGVHSIYTQKYIGFLQNFIKTK